MTHRDFGKLVGVSEQTVRLWEMGCIKISEADLDRAVHETAALLAMRSTTLLKVIQKPALTGPA